MKKISRKKLTIFVIFLSLISFLAVFDVTNENFSIINTARNLFAFNNNSTRKKYSFNNDWKFSIGEGRYDSGSDYDHYCLISDLTNCVDATSSPGAEYTLVSTTSKVTLTDGVFNNSFDASNDGRFSDVSLPHTYNDIDSFDNYTEGAQNGNRSTYTGTAWYKKTFFLPSTLEGKKIYVEFEGARQAMSVYVNGTLLNGTYENGFIPVGYDLTPYVNFGENNYITVMTDNTFPYYITNTLNGSTNSKILWHNSHWHPNYGGLYRNSYLYVMDNLHLTLPLYSFIEGEGTYIYTSNITVDDSYNTSATINVDPQVENSGANAQSFNIKATVKDASGAIVGAITSSEYTLAQGSKESYHLEIDVSNVTRWSTEYPYLYTVETEIIQNDNVIDNNSEEIGIKTFRITNDSGFYLNENKITLNGWGQKSTMEWAGLGSAYPDWMTDYVIKLMKDANANYVRWGHTSGSPVQISSCNKYGLLVTQPGVDGEGNLEGTYDVNSAKLRIEAMRDMIIYFRNNPSIIMWEIGNFGNVPVTLSSEYINSISGLPEATESDTMFNVLSQVINQYDYGNRGTIVNSGSFATSQTDDNRLVTVRTANSTISNLIDVEETTQGSKYLSGKTYVEGEYNRLESARGIWDTYANTFSTSNNYYKTSEDFALSQIKNIGGFVTGNNAIVNATGGVGGANWIFSDSESHGRVTEHVTRASGEVDAVMLPKEAYYVDQVIFNNEPDIYIVGPWNYSAGTVKTIYVAASGVSSVELYVNGTQYAGSLSDNFLWTFNNVTWESGTITARGYNNVGTEVATYSKSSHGEPNSIRITPIVGNEGLRANGSDILLLDVEVVDIDGNRCTTYDGITNNDLVTFSVNDGTGTSIWRGGYNSTIASSTNKKSLYLEAGINRVALKTTMTDGNIVVSASSTSGLTSNTVSLTSTEVTNTVDNIIGVSPLSSTATYSLTNLTDPGYGSAIIEIVDPTLTNASTLITNMNYIGSVDDGNGNDYNNGLAYALGSGSKMYSDSDVTFTNVPYKYRNAEYLLLPNADSTATASDLTNFQVKKDIDIYVLRDSTAVVPTWLNSYNLMTDVIIGGNGVQYNIYRTTANAGDFVNLGGNVDTVSDGIDKQNQIIIFKETTKVANYVFFDEDFKTYDTESLYNGWNIYKDYNTNVLLDTTSFATPAVHLTDTNAPLGNASGVANMEKRFTPLTGEFVVSVRAFVPYNIDTNYNDWLGIWLTDGPLLTANDKDHLGVETYINANDDGSLFFNGKKNPSQSGITSLATSYNNITSGAWHTYKMYVDVESKTYKLGLDDEIDSSIVYPFTVNSMSSLNNIVIRTWSGKYSDYFVDEVTITPVVNDIIDNVRIDNIPVEGFAGDSYTYYVENLNSSSVLTFDTNDYFVSSSTVYDNTNNILTLTVTNINNQSYNYVFNNVDNADILTGWTIETPTDTNIAVTSKDGVDVIRLTDDSLSNMSYMMKHFTTSSPTLKVSYSAFVTGGKTNKYLRLWLLDGPMTDVNFKANLGFATYLHYDSNLKILNEINYSSSAGKGTNTQIFSGNRVNQWYKYTYLIDRVNNTFDVFIDDVLVLEDQELLQNKANLDYIVIGTGASTTSDYYVKDITIEDIYNSPLTGLSINDEILGNFSADTLEYEFFSEDVLDVNTSFDLTYDETYISHEVIRNYTDQIATIKVFNSNGQEFDYIINFKTIADMDVTKEMLQDIVDEVNALISSDYSAGTWSILSDYMIEGNRVLALEEPSNILLATTYNNIVKAKQGLIRMNTYDTYQTGMFNDIKYSSDLEGIFGIAPILANDKPIYSDQEFTFRSVPKKYLNSEYFLVNNQQLNTHGEFRFQITAASNISVMIFRDRLAGEVIESGYTYTGDVVTGSNGVVYKVYRRDYNTGEIVSIDFKKLVNNPLTNSNSIVAIKSTVDVINNIFLDLDVTKYSNYDNFSKSWNVSNDFPNYNNIDIQVKDDKSAIYLNSTTVNGTSSTYNAAWASVNFADITSGKYILNYKVYADPLLTGTTDNGYTRVWFVKDTIINQNVINANNADKANTLIDYYVDYATSSTFAGPSGGTVGSKKLKGLFQTAPVGGKQNKMALNSTALSLGTWIPISQTIDMDNKTWDSNVDGTVVTGLPFYLDLNPINIFLLSTRRTGTTSMWFSEMSIDLVENEYIDALTVNNNNVNTYTSATKDYLYRYSPLETTLTANYTAGNNASIINSTNQEEYTNITSTVTSTVKQDNRIYYELATDKKNLTTLILESLELEETLYTPSSWNNFIISLNNAKIILSDLEATQSEIDDAYADLLVKKDALVIKGNINYIYSGDMYYGNDLNSSSNSNTYITNDSSFTFEATMNINIGETYEYDNEVHNRILINSTNFPTNTKLTLIDKSTSNYSYYYYIVNTPTSRIYLSDFIKMGTLDVYFGTSDYYNSTTQKIFEDLSIIVDYGASDTKLAFGTYTIKLQNEVLDKVMDMTALSYTITDRASSYSIVSQISNEIYKSSDEIDLSLVSNYVHAKYDNSINAMDTKRFNQRYGLKFTLLQNNIEVDMPKGTKIYYNTYSCYANGSNCTIFLDNINSISRSTTDMIIDFNTYEKLPSGRYTFRLDLIESENGVNLGQVVATVNQLLTIENGTITALKVDTINTNIIKSTDVSTLTYSFTKLNDINSNIVVSLEKKTDGVYSEVDLNSYVTNNPTEYTTNRYNFGDIDTLTLYLNGSLPSGTYKLVFELLESSVSKNRVEKYIIVK